MKKLLVLVLLFSFSILFSQTKEVGEFDDIIIKKVLKEKPEKYFELDSFLKKNKISIKGLEKLKKESNTEKYFLGKIYALHALGVYYRNSTKYSKAITVLEEAIEIAEKIDNTTVKVILFNTIGSVYRKQNNVEKALMYHQNALVEAEQIKNLSSENRKSISVAENNIGNLYMMLGQYDLALEKFEKALEVRKDLNDLKGLAINHQNIGKALEESGKVDLALKSYEKSLEYNIKNKSVVGEIICYNSICNILIAKGDYKEALQIAEANYERVKGSKDKYYYCQTITKLGLAYIKNDKLEKATPIVNEALEVAKNNNYDEFKVENLFNLSELYTKLNDKESSFSYFKQAVEEEKRTKEKLNSLFIKNLVSNFNVKPKFNSIEIFQDKEKLKNLSDGRNRNVLIITLISLALLSVALYSIYRQRLLNNDRQVLLLEQQALQTQMNPHFLFNALNSIKLYIINNEQKNAVFYLNKFSKLIRNILDVSKVKEVSLKDELDTMDLYMSIENIRFNNEIKYVKKINPSLNLETIKLPPLLLQPFLENSIWHGLSSKEGDKEVVLSAFKVSKNLVEIDITDNGVGRKMAMEIKQRKSLKRKSIGLDLTKERLKTFANDFLHDYSLKYYDLYDNEGNAKGTKVAIRIPLQ